MTDPGKSTIERIRLYRHHTKLARFFLVMALLSAVSTVFVAIETGSFVAILAHLAVFALAVERQCAATDAARLNR